MNQRPTKTKATISKIINLTPDVKHFEITLQTPMQFKAGQFVNLSIEHKDKTLRKPYSIANHPIENKETNKIELCIKLVDNGELTPILFEKKEGDEVEIMGGLGLFTLQKANKNNLVFIATGTGIAPFRSMIKDLIAKEEEIQITLLFGVRHQGHHCYNQEFEDLEKLSPQFKYVPILSRPNENWDKRQGHVQENLDLIDPLNSQVFICGLPQMVDSVKEKLILKGMNQEDIFYEKY